MSFANRNFPDIGEKMLQGPTVYSSYPYNPVPNSAAADQTRQPLQFQLVDDTDSHFEPLLLGVDLDAGAGNGLDITFPLAALATEVPYFRGTDGIFGNADDPQTADMPMYQALIQIAFQDRWWNAPSTGVPDPILGVNQQLRTPDGFTLMEANFSMFFGVAVQMYEMTLRADRTPFDLFMEGDNTFGTTGQGIAFGMTDAELLQMRLRGLLTFIKTDQFFQQTNPIFNGINDGNCVFCHGGPALSNAGTFVPEVDVEIEVEFVNGRLVEELNQLGLEEDSFNNIGVRPSREDLGRGGSENGQAGIAPAPTCPAPLPCPGCRQPWTALPAR